MKKLSKTRFGVLLIMIVILSMASVSFAGNQHAQNSDEIKVTENNFTLTKSEQTQYEDYQKGVVDCIRKEYSENGGEITPSKIEEVLTEYNSNTTDPVAEKIKKITGISNGSELTIKEEVLIDNKITEKYSNTFAIAENVDVTVTPTTVYVDELDVEYIEEKETFIDNLIGAFVDTAKAASEWKTVSVAARRSLFTSTGKRAASVHTGGKIQYNGSKAKYKSDFYGYYHLYYTTWRNLVFEKVKEASGKSYQFYAYGIFYKEYAGVSNKSKKISCKVKVSPKGKVTKYYYPEL